MDLVACFVYWYALFVALDLLSVGGLVLCGLLLVAACWLRLVVYVFAYSYIYCLF